jgi:hypothetical protein
MFEVLLVWSAICFGAIFTIADYIVTPQPSMIEGLRLVSTPSDLLWEWDTSWQGKDLTIHMTSDSCRPFIITGK